LDLVPTPMIVAVAVAAGLTEQMMGDKRFVDVADA
jgi:hypothetical protein